MLKENIDLETEIDSSDIFEWFEGNNSLKQNIIDTNIDWKKDAEIDSSNIFKWFEGDINLKQDIIDINESSDKDIYYYLSKVWKFNEIVFIFFLLFTIIAYWYVSIQKNEEIINSGSLDPFCKIILWDIENPDSNCSSIFALSKNYQDEYKKLKDEQTWQILEILWKVYEIENFIKSKEVVFILNEWEGKLKPLEILEEFDNLKRNFEVEKDKIICTDISITIDNILSLKCDIKSAPGEYILWFDWTNQTLVKWSSISLASSFLNYIEITSKNFIILNKQKTFSSEIVLWNDSNFNKKTTVNLKLRYIPNNLSL